LTRGSRDVTKSRMTDRMIEKEAQLEAELPAGAKENLELLEKFDERQSEASGLQRAIERVSAFFGSPSYFLFSILFIVVWIALNAWGAHSGWRHVDAPPFPLLQGLVSSNALLLTIAVLIRQNRMAQIAEHRSHLDLQINLLTEQKVTKVLELVDAAVREIKNIRGAPAEAPRARMEEMTKPADPHAILDAIKQKQS
jgi:uncharacterized membrane protein